MVSLFRENSSGSIFWLLLLSLGLHACFIVQAPEVVAAHGTGALGGLFFLAPPLPGFILVVIYHTLVVLQALRLNHIASELRLFSKVSYTVAMAYLLLTALFEPWAHITPALLCNSLIIWLFGKMVRLQVAALPRQVIFNIGFIAGLLVMLYHPSVTLVPLCLIAIAILRTFRLNEWFIVLLGVFTPFYLLVSLLFLGGNLGDIWLYIPEWGVNFIPPAHTPIFIGTAVVLCLLILSGIFLWRTNATRSLIQVRKAWTVLLLTLALLIPVMFVCKDAGFEAGIMAMVPASVFVAGVFIYPRRGWLPALVFWLLAGLSVYNNWPQ